MVSLSVLMLVDLLMYLEDYTKPEDTRFDPTSGLLLTRKTALYCSMPDT